MERMSIGPVMKSCICNYTKEEVYSVYNYMNDFDHSRPLRIEIIWKSGWLRAEN